MRGVARNASIDCLSAQLVPSRAYCLGISPPSRWPRPAATMTPAINIRPWYPDSGVQSKPPVGRDRFPPLDRAAGTVMVGLPRDPEPQPCPPPASPTSTAPASSSPAAARESAPPSPRASSPRAPASPSCSAPTPRTSPPTSAARYDRAPLFLRCDVTDIPALQAAMAEAAAAHGPITVLVNNAANDQRHPVEGYTVEEWDAAQAVNLRPHFFTAQAAIPGMKAAGGGAIVNYSSISYLLGADGYPVLRRRQGGDHRPDLRPRPHARARQHPGQRHPARGGADRAPAPALGDARRAPAPSSSASA